MTARGNAPGIVPKAINRPEGAEDSRAPSGRKTINGLRNPGRCPGLAFFGAFSAEEEDHDLAATQEVLGIRFFAAGEQSIFV